MDYIELDCSIQPKDKGLDIVIAILGEIGFESFEETERGVKAYIQAPDFSETAIAENAYLQKNEFFDIQLNKQLIKEQNWNAVWESNFEPILISDVYIRAPFHKSVENVKNDILIEPKMSFGTGHHETTGLMVEEMSNMELKGKTVLDMGCGTGILAILAAKMGAGSVTGVDIDAWAYSNARENTERNKTPEINLLLGSVESLGNQKFDVILANINRNILLKDLPAYNALLNAHGSLLMSGFLDTDLEMIKDALAAQNIVFKCHKSKGHWTMVTGYKQ